MGLLVIWDGRDDFNSFVETGNYRLRLIGMDKEDNIGVSMDVVNIRVVNNLGLPPRLVRFEVRGGNIVRPGTEVWIDFELSEIISGTLTIRDKDGGIKDVYAFQGMREGSYRWVGSNETGVYMCTLSGKDEEQLPIEATIPIVVSEGDVGSGEVEITFPMPGQIVEGKANFAWEGKAKGEYYPDLTKTVKVKGWAVEQKWPKYEFDWKVGARRWVEAVAEGEAEKGGAVYRIDHSLGMKRYQRLVWYKL
jgi:hypothetical protein